MLFLVVVLVLIVPLALADRERGAPWERLD